MGQFGRGSKTLHYSPANTHSALIIHREADSLGHKRKFVIAKCICRYLSSTDVIMTVWVCIGKHSVPLSDRTPSNAVSMFRPSIHHTAR